MPGVALPHWIIGYERPALLSGVMALVVLALVPRLTGRTDS